MTGTEAEVRELRKMQFFGRKRVGNSRVEFDATMRVLALCDAWEAQRAALRKIAALGDEFTAPNWYVAQAEIAQVARAALAGVGNVPNDER